MAILRLLVFACALVAGAQADFECLCAYAVETQIYDRPDISANNIGYMYEFDCKPSYRGLVAPPGWQLVATEHQVGYVQNSTTVEIQVCPGSIPDEDKATTTPMPTTTSTTPKPTTTTTTPTPATTTTTTMRPTTTQYISQCPVAVLRRNHDLSYIFKHHSYCYEFRNELQDWEHAKLDCQDNGGFLLSIQSQDEQDFVLTMMRLLRKPQPIWLGLHDLVHEEQWQWVSGQPLKYKNWMSGSHHDMYHDFEDCALYVPARHGEWDDVHCRGLLFDLQASHPWICQYRVIYLKPTTTTATATTTPKPTTATTTTPRPTTTTTTPKPTTATTTTPRPTTTTTTPKPTTATTTTPRPTTTTTTPKPTTATTTTPRPTTTTTTPKPTTATTTTPRPTTTTTTPKPTTTTTTPRPTTTTTTTMRPTTTQYMTTTTQKTTPKNGAWCC